MIEVKQIHSEEIFIVNQLAHQVWPDTYKDILSKDQIDYMLDWMYNINTLQEEVLTGKLYYLLTENGRPTGYLGLEPNYPDADMIQIHKIYILTERQGNGLGRALINQAMDVAFDLGGKSLNLNVNRFNKSVDFYKNIGFKIIGEEDIDIGKDYWMEDYKMELILKKV